MGGMSPTVTSRLTGPGGLIELAGVLDPARFTVRYWTGPLFPSWSATYGAPAVPSALEKTTVLLQFPPPLTPYLTAVRLTGLRPVLVELSGGVKVMLQELEVVPSYM